MYQANRLYRYLTFICLFLLGASTVLLYWLFVHFLPSQHHSTDDISLYQQSAVSQYTTLIEQTERINALQVSSQTTLIDDTSLQSKVGAIQDSISTQDSQLAIVKANILHEQIEPFVQQLHTLAVTKETVQAQKVDLSQALQRSSNLQNSTSANSHTVPILIYHQMPANFAQQADYLKTRGYTTISMRELADALDKKLSLPSKPVVLTFDDGFSDNMKTIPILKARNMKATYYLIVGSERSRWCIGVLRKATNCGDSYMNWQEIKQLRDSGVAEIGVHTMNHFNLSGLSGADQQYEIVEAKKVLDKELGISTDTFAYPYGKYNATSLDTVRRAGFRTAVTTVDGKTASSNNRYTLPRVRNAMQLP